MAKLHLPPRFDVLGVGISVLNLGSAKALLLQAAHTAGHLGYVTVTGVHGVVESGDSPELLAIHNKSFLTTPDGMPLVWLGRHAGHDSVDRVSGPDLLREVLAASSGSGERHFFFGGAEGVAAKLKSEAGQRFPGVTVCGVESPPFRELAESELDDLVARINEVKPHFIWVGLSTPKQEKFMHSFIKSRGHQLELGDRGLTLLGVGAAFDFYTGRAPQAPLFIQRSGFEWFFRLCTSPRRLWRRYLKIVPVFLWRVLPSLVRD